MTPRIGIGTPQANPTVEAEMRRLLPPDVDFVTLRLTCADPDPLVRLRAYLTDLPALSRQFAGMRIDAFAFACTASSYLVSAEDEADALSVASRALGAPVLTATAALAAELEALRVRRIALVSPYPPALVAAAEVWWRGRGFDVATIVRVDIGSTDTTRIYELTADDAWTALERADFDNAGAVVLSGTGMPTAPILARAAAKFGLPVLSSNLALARQCLRLVGRTLGDLP